MISLPVRTRVMTTRASVSLISDWLFEAVKPPLDIACGLFDLNTVLGLSLPFNTSRLETYGLLFCVSWFLLFRPSLPWNSI